uniref:Uncharacterized protein n=1 Tax=Cacopsylla melanoneura TaxID=428564 RepID=A0A8D8YPV5_9HEMI
MKRSEEQYRKGVWKKKFMKRRLRWYGHQQRMENERLPKKIYDLRMEGNRPKGRPRYRYRDVVNTNIEKKEGCWNDIETRELFKDRRKERVRMILKPGNCLKIDFGGDVLYIDLSSR